MASTTTSVLGVEIPSTSLLFLAIVGLHVVLGLTAVLVGAVAMLSEKGMPRHIVFGQTYYWCLAALFASASVLALIRWAEDDHLFVLGALAFAAATFGRSAAKRKWRNWPRLHIAGMGSSYIVMLTAFYVDNGKNLPLWRDLHPIAYWTVPAIIGAPIMIWALLRHPVVRSCRSCR
jgi:hypothetical protein